jgi:hypothetical protein
VGGSQSGLMETGPARCAERNGEEAVVRHIAAFAGPLALLCAGQAIAADTSIPQLSPSLRYEVKGQVAATCSLSNTAEGGAVEFRNAVDTSTNLGRADTARLPFTVACNTPIAIRMESTQGGLNNAVTTSDQDFTSLIAYTAQLNLPQRANVLSCTSVSMKAGQNGCRGEVTDAVTEGQGAVDVTLNPDGRLLLQGTYADRVTLTLTPILGGVGSGT